MQKHTHTPSRAGLIQTAGLLTRLSQMMLLSVSRCPEGTGLSFYLQDLTGPPSPGGRSSSPPFPATGLSRSLGCIIDELICHAGLSNSLCTTDGFYSNRVCSQKKFEWCLVIIAVDVCMCSVYGWINEWTNKQV